MVRSNADLAPYWQRKSRRGYKKTVTTDAVYLFTYPCRTHFAPFL